MKKTAKQPSVLEGLDLGKLIVWIESALRGKTFVALTDRDDTISLRIYGEISRARKEQQMRCKVAISTLLQRTCTRTAPKNEYMQELVKLAKYTKTTSAAHYLLRHASAFRKTRNRFDWETNRTILFALLELGYKGDVIFWKDMFHINPKEFGAAVIAGLLETNQDAMFEIIKILPNRSELGDVTALNLDYKSDRLSPTRRASFQKKAAVAAKESQPKIKLALETWLTEYDQ